jgi:hypothetical protein
LLWGASERLGGRERERERETEKHKSKIEGERSVYMGSAALDRATHIPLVPCSDVKKNNGALAAVNQGLVVNPQHVTGRADRVPYHAVELEDRVRVKRGRLVRRTDITDHGTQ